MYWKYTAGQFTTWEEEAMLILRYDPARQLTDQVGFRSFDFFSIIDDHDQQQHPALFGLGVMAPLHPVQRPGERAPEVEGYANLLTWLRREHYTTRELVSLYLGNGPPRDQDGSGAADGDDTKEKYGLPDPVLRFGDYNSTNIVQDETLYFWTVTSQYNWTLDLYGV